MDKSEHEIKNIDLPCCAKINLSLEVMGRRSDGFHELKTLMHEIDLMDHLKVGLSETAQDELHIEGMAIPGDIRDNLILKGLRAFRDCGYEVPALKLHLLKNIPTGGGLGGGSSDVLSLLCHLAERYRMPIEELSALAASLGSDTNFFIRGGTAWCYGRGERVQRVEAHRYYFNLILPDWGCSTPVVFSKLEAKPLGDHVALMEESTYEMGRNDLEKACARAYPEMKSLLKRLRAAGVDVHLSGSGSTLFTVHDDFACRDQTQEVLGRVCDGVSIMRAQSYQR